MGTFMIFHSNVKDSKKFQGYAQSVPNTLKPFGGELMAKGKAMKVLSGSHDHQNVGILKFPDSANANGWYESQEYQDLIPSRDEAADMTIISYEEP